MWLPGSSGGSFFARGAWFVFIGKLLSPPKRAGLVIGPAPVILAKRASLSIALGRWLRNSPRLDLTAASRADDANSPLPRRRAAAFCWRAEP